MAIWQPLNLLSYLTQHPGAIFSATQHSKGQ
jgi:hypothetical protein